MRPNHRITRLAGRFLAALAAAIFASLAAAQTAVPSAPPPTSAKLSGLEGLRAELSAERSQFTPAQPLRVRFLLSNTSDSSIEVPAAFALGEDMATLPPSVIYGELSAPSLMVHYENEPAYTLRPANLPEAKPGALRLPPHGVIGVEIDLRPVDKLMRYSGTHKIEWRPFGGKLEPATLELRTEPRKNAILVTDLGKLNIVLAYDTAPRNVENFLELARTKFYDGTVFHRLVPNFIIQGGSPNSGSTGTRPDGRFLPPEFNKQPFEAGTVAMALRGTDPNSASCQFFIALSREPELDGNYTIIGVARDEESQRTLQAFNEQPTNEKDRPLRPIVIRYISLYDAETPMTRSAESARQP